MKELTRVFDGHNIEIEIIDEENMYFTVGSIARKYGKNITEWKESKRIKETIRMLEKSNGLNLNLIKENAFGKTQIHKKLFVNFARFISVAFEIKADEIITEILLDGKHLCEKERAVFANQLQSVQNQLEISQQQTIEAITGKIYKDGLIALSTYIKNRELTISLYGAFEILKEKNIVEVKQVEAWRKVLIDGEYGVQKEHTDVIEFDTKMLDEIFFGKVMTQSGLF